MSYYRIQNTPAADLLAEGQTSFSYRTHTERSGKSVCDTIEDLARYLVEVGIGWDPDTYSLVELEGYQSDDEDEDAGLGYGVSLVHPTRIVSETPIMDTDLMTIIDELFDAAA